MSEIQNWINKIIKGVWDSFGDSAPEITSMIGVMVASNLMRPSASHWGRISERGRLARAYQGQSEAVENLSKSETEIIHERKIQVPYAKILEKGGQTKVTSRVAGAMYRLYKMTGDKKYLKAFLSARLGWKSFFEHKSHPYLSEAYSSMTIDKISNPIRRNIEKRLNMIENLEVILGNK